MISIGLLASGSLGLLGLKTVLKEMQLRWVLTDASSIPIISMCEGATIPCHSGNPRLSRDYQDIANDVDLILSVNYLFIAPQELLDLASICSVNIHGSLLPKYRGRTPHVWAIINNERETGVTAHLMEADCDAGPILFRHVIPIGADDTGGSILNMFHSLYPRVIHEVIARVQSNSLTASDQDVKLATYFGKRTPEDGQIKWSWQRERIRNWVRAQARPYPGAFFVLRGECVHVHHCQYSDLGFSETTPDGTVLQADPLVVKTPNGAVELSDLSPNSSEFRTGDLLE